MIGSIVKFKSANEAATFTINDRENQPLLQAQSPFYYISVTNIDGLRQADISFESHPIPNATGEKSGDVFRRGRTITLSGFVMGHNLGYLDVGCDYLQQMFTETTPRKLIWTRKSDNIEIYLKCRVTQDLAIAESIAGTAIRFAWVVGLRADQPITRKTSDNSIYPTWQS